MAGSRMPIAVSHGEGLAEFASPEALAIAEASGTINLRFVNGKGDIATQYPQNPNGSQMALTGIVTDGRVTFDDATPRTCVQDCRELLASRCLG